MTRDYFRKGGPFNAKRIDEDHIAWDVPIGADEGGRIARKCPDETCSPGYFKVSLGTGITEAQEFAYCPYCKHRDEPSAYFSEEQVRYARDVAFHEAAHALQNAFKGAFKGQGNAVTYKPKRIAAPRRPYEETVRRDVICPNCTLDHAVFGLATWCPDCGSDIFTTHVEAELDVVRAMLSDTERRREELGARIEAKDVENCLEDVVSIYEAVLKALLGRYLKQKGMESDEVEKLMSKKVRNGFQNVERSRAIILEHTGHELFDTIDGSAVSDLKNAFEMRHPITHNLGVIDRKYLERSLEAAQEGREIRVTRPVVEQSITTCLEVVSTLHTRLFPDERQEPQGDEL